MTCIIKDCEGKIIAHHYCRKHLQRFYRYGDPTVKNKQGRKIIKNCKKCGKRRSPGVPMALCKECNAKYFRASASRFRARYPEKVYKYRLTHEIKQRLEALK